MRWRVTKRPDTRPLRLIGLDAALTGEQLERLALHTDVIYVRAGEVLCHAGTTPLQLITVIDGEVDVTDPSGRTQVAGAGTRIGGTEIIHQHVHEHTVVTRTECTLVVIYGRALEWTAHLPRSARHQPLPTTVAEWANRATPSEPDHPRRQPTDGEFSYRHPPKDLTEANPTDTTVDRPSQPAALTAQRG